jgi:hypothetical protein
MAGSIASPRGLVIVTELETPCWCGAVSYGEAVYSGVNVEGSRGLRAWRVEATLSQGEVAVLWIHTEGAWALRQSRG